jgi:hypothetical protein
VSVEVGFKKMEGGFWDSSSGDCGFKKPVLGMMFSRWLGWVRRLKVEG